MQPSRFTSFLEWKQAKLLWSSHFRQLISWRSLKVDQSAVNNEINMPNRSRSIHPSRLFRSVSPQSPAFYVHSCCFPRQTTLSVDLQLFIAATSLIRVFLRAARERVGYESMFRGRRKHKSFVRERKRRKKSVFVQRAHFPSSRSLGVISSNSDVDEAIGRQSVLARWIVLDLKSCVGLSCNKRKPGCRFESMWKRISSLKIERIKEKN